MGNNACSPSPETIDSVFWAGQAGGIIPDITLDRSLSNYLSLNSSFALNSQYAAIQRHLSKDRLAVLDSNLTSIFGHSSRVSYGGVGIVALALSFLLDTLVGQTSDPYQRIFGPDYSSEIPTVAREYLTQVPWKVNDSDGMAEMTEIYDQKLKYALIELYENMTIDHHLNTAAIKQWINGAAIHLHMRIHGIRMFSVPKGSAESLRLSYRTGLGRVLQLYTGYLRRNVKERSATLDPSIKAGFLITEPSKKVRHRVVHNACQTQSIIGAVVARILAAQNVRTTETFFDEPARLIDKFVRQREHFELPTRNASRHS
ncbi:hypothetical protein AMEX_G19343 [Astyanax mexicanus]|uniref:Uncharacterized protein n=1 Tax=Astyanax mexicanus TaxID=7994 RepID=A0A8T2LBK5_ASTMX|nr:hypothetical protein AMEX_G19343 [Astyanax mexicanus]